MPWKPGQSGNRRGRPVGCRNKASLQIEQTMLGEAELITRTCIEKAQNGDMTAIKLVLERICPIRKRLGMTLNLPAINNAQDLLPAINTVTDAFASDQLDIDGANTMLTLIEAKRRVIETVELERRIKMLEGNTRTPAIEHKDDEIIIDYETQ